MKMAIVLGLAFIGGFLGNLLAYWVVFRTWKFPRIVVVPMERIHEISKWIKESRR